MPRRHRGTLRRCIGCMISQDKDRLLRLVLEDGHLSLDSSFNKEGRGAYLCKNLECFKKAVKKNAFSRTFRREVKKEEIENLLVLLEKELGEQ